MEDTFKLLFEIAKILFLILILGLSLCGILYCNADLLTSEPNQEEMRMNDSEETKQAEHVVIVEQTNSENETSESNIVDRKFWVTFIIVIITSLSIILNNYVLKKEQNQHEIISKTDYENSNEVPVPDKIETLSVKIRQLLDEKFGTESLTYGKYEAVISTAITQYNKNVQKIKSYKVLKKEVSKSKKEKIQPKIDELKKKNDNLISNLEDLYISLSITEENDTDSKIQNLQETTEELKYYHL